MLRFTPFAINNNAIYVAILGDRMQAALACAKRGLGFWCLKTDYTTSRRFGPISFGYVNIKAIDTICRWREEDVISTRLNEIGTLYLFQPELVQTDLFDPQELLLF